ncbi:hypothetical protein ILUMI_05703 [Ignelater luminosus]|uniref:PiggyBac transposable element-derived protein domain-containing protein n=1 Tax=Ignelater luminosus TaxID=2038154 RepID=A0A8K0D9Z7_IGNLU|nr:hypothetical protein ILUMI_05703 [Ignelater luminosus]
MAGRSKVNLEELELMDPVDVFNFIDGISEEQALDSDADDYFPMSLTPSTIKSRKKDHEEISDFSSDDSTADPNFLPERKKKFPRNATIASSSDEDDELFINTNPPKPGVAFTETPGLKIPVSESPLENFFNILVKDLLNTIVTESIQYARQKGTSLDLSLNESKAFIEILVIMGLNSLPSLRLYWLSDQNFHSARDFEDTTLSTYPR